MTRQSNWFSTDLTSSPTSSPYSIKSHVQGWSVEKFRARLKFLREQWSEKIFDSKRMKRSWSVKQSRYNLIKLFHTCSLALHTHTLVEAKAVASFPLTVIISFPTSPRDTLMSNARNIFRAVIAESICAAIDRNIYDCVGDYKRQTKTKLD